MCCADGMERIVPHDLEEDSLDASLEEQVEKPEETSNSTVVSENMLENTIRSLFLVS